jgi:hypothetical protein
MGQVIEYPSNSSPTRSIFLSYRRVDDEPPPEDPSGKYVEHLRKQLIWELRQLGVPKTVLWMDRYEIEGGDVWPEELRRGLEKSDLFIALLSRNYITSRWCEQELTAMAERIANCEPDLRKQRIFRVDKHFVPETKIHDVLKNVQAIRFYEEDLETNSEEEFYYRGRVVHEAKYFDAIHELAVIIYRRLERLGVEMAPQAQPPSVERPSNGRVVFVARPARDMKSEYVALTSELTRAGYRVVPDWKTELPLTAEEAQATIAAGLAEAEFSIHVLGEMSGFRPDGLDAGIVSLQFRAAAEEVARRQSFYRLVWAPQVLPSRAAENLARRDPFEVMRKFGEALCSDEVDGDTPARFTQFVLQRLSTKTSQPSADVSKTVYVHCADGDREYAWKACQALRAKGLSPVIPDPPEENTPEDIFLKHVGDARRAVLCWANASKTAILSVVTDSTLARWRNGERDNRSITLLVGPPSSRSKTEAIDIGLGEAIDRVVDMTGTSDIDPKLLL